MLERLRGMEKSRFWHFRNRFFDLKYRLGLSRDRAWPPFELPELQRAMLDADESYAAWTAANAARPADIDRMRSASNRLVYKPVFSIVLGIPDVATQLERALRSIRDQAYPHWQIIVATTRRSDDVVRAVIERVFAEAPASNVLRVKDPIATSRVALLRGASSRASGAYVAFLDPADAFAPDALYEFACVFNDDPKIDIVFGDEDVRCSDAPTVVPFFKPDWAPESILSRDYVGSGAIYRRGLVEQIGGFHDEFEDAAEYDLLLRAGERTDAIAHVSRVLYHRERIPSYGEAGARAVGESLARAGEAGTVELIASTFPTYRVRYRLRDPGLVSIVIPTRDHAEDLERCLSSLFERTTYPRFEVLVVDNDTKDTRALEVLATWAARDDRMRVLPMPIPFNYSKLNNDAVRVSHGEYVVLLNNDTEVLTGDWLEAMMEQAQRPAIGAVGASLVFSDRSVQHGGVILGIGGVAGHSHRYAESDSAGYFGALRATSNYAAVTAACLMVRRETFDSVGGIDEELTVAYNDVDFCLRIRERGLRNVWLPHVVLVHGESKSRGYDVGLVKERRSIREEALMLARWGPLIECDPYYNANLTRRAEDFSIRLAWS